MAMSGLTSGVELRILVILAAALAGTAVAPASASPLRLTVEAQAPVTAGEQGELRLVLRLESPWYIYAPTGGNAAQDMLETGVTMRRHEQIQFAGAKFPAAEPYGTFTIFTGDIVVTQPFRVRPRTEAGVYGVHGAVDYQICDGEICLPPDTAEFMVEIHVE